MKWHSDTLIFCLYRKPEWYNIAVKALNIQQDTLQIKLFHKHLERVLNKRFPSMTSIYIKFKKSTSVIKIIEIKMRKCSYKSLSKGSTNNDYIRVTECR